MEACKDGLICKHCGRRLPKTKHKAVCRCDKQPTPPPIKGQDPRPHQIICKHLGRFSGVVSCGCAGKHDAFWCNHLEGHTTLYQLGKSWFKTDVGDRIGRLSACSHCEHRESVFELQPQPRISGMVAVTALSALPKHQQRQPICLDSWKDVGLEIVAVNTSEEYKRLRPLYHQVDHWIICDDVASPFATDTQRIKTLLDVSIRLNMPIMLINSDIEIHGSQSRLIHARDAAKKNNTVSVGIRWNYGVEIESAKREQWGLDVFVVSPQAAESVPQLPFAIGRPMWDYWLPYHFRLLGYEQNWIGEPYFFHQMHPLHWSDADWKMGAAWMRDHYGTDMWDYESSAEFRRSFPF